MNVHNEELVLFKNYSWFKVFLSEYRKVAKEYYMAPNEIFTFLAGEWRGSDKLFKQEASDIIYEHAYKILLKYNTSLLVWYQRRKVN